MGLYTSIRVKNGGNWYNIDDGVTLLVEGYASLGFPPVRRLTYRGARQDGHTDTGMLLEPRRVSFKLAGLASTHALMYSRRATLAAAFAPGTTPINLEFTTPSSEVRQLDCHLVDGLTFPSDQYLGHNFRDVVVLEAPDPCFYDPAQKFVQWTVTGIADLIFPVTFPIQFCASFVNEAQVIGYEGSWKTYPIIELGGPMQNPKLTNQTLSEKIELGYNISNGEIVTIDLTPGVKTVKNGSGTNLIGTLTSDSDLGTFHIGAHPEAASGNNSMKLEAGGMTTGTSYVKLYWYDRFLAITA